MIIFGGNVIRLEWVCGDDVLDGVNVFALAMP